MPIIGKGRIDVTEGFIRDRKALKTILVGSEQDLEQKSEQSEHIPSMAENYAEQQSEFLDIPVDEVKRSEPFRNYLDKLRGKR